MAIVFFQIVAEHALLYDKLIAHHLTVKQKSFLCNLDCKIPLASLQGEKLIKQNMLNQVPEKLLNR